MQIIKEQIIHKLHTLSLLNIDINLSKKIIDIAISSVKSFIICEIDYHFDFIEFKDIFIDITIGEYLTLIKNAGLDENIDFESAIKTISEGDVSITYFKDKFSKAERFLALIQYFLDKKTLLTNFKSIRW